MLCLRSVYIVVFCSLLIGCSKEPKQALDDFYADSHKALDRCESLPSQQATAECVNTFITEEFPEIVKLSAFGELPAEQQPGLDQYVAEQTDKLQQRIITLTNSVQP